MPRQLTPEELEIIRQTEREGAELAEREQGRTGAQGTLRRIEGILLFAAVFAAFVCIACFVLSATAK